MLIRKIKSWCQGRQRRGRLTTSDRRPFYDVAAEYLPGDAEGVILDVGAGDGGFVDQLGLADRYRHVHLLDGNEEAVARLAERFGGATLYRAPGRLDFGDGTVAMVHCSHMIEHLQTTELHGFLREVDRVLTGGGVLVLSTPMMSESFYSDLTHIRPYSYGALLDYLSVETPNQTRQAVSRSYSLAELTFRYGASYPSLDRGWGSEWAFVDLLITVAKCLARVLRIRNYQRTGYTLVLRKSAGD